MTLDADKAVRARAPPSALRILGGWLNSVRLLEVALHACLSSFGRCSSYLGGSESMRRRGITRRPRPSTSGGSTLWRTACCRWWWLTC